MPYICPGSIKSTSINIINKESSSEENLVTKNQFSLIDPHTKITVLSPDALANAMKIANSVKSSMNTEYLLPHQFIKFPVNQENTVLTDIYTLPPYEDNKNRSTPLSIINLEKNNTSPKNIKWDKKPMEINNSSRQTVNTKNSRFLINDFGINKLKHFFHESIEKVKSTGKIQALVMVNKITPREKDLYNVKFYNKKGTIEIQKAHKENAVMLNDVKNSIISLSGKEKEKLNQLDELHKETYTIEKEILEIKKSNPENIGYLENKLNYTEFAKILIDECIRSSNDERDNKLIATIETMNGVVDKLKNQLDHLKKNQSSIINTTIENNIYKSNDSLNSNSSGYFSEIMDDSGYSSEETTKIHIKNDHITTQKNKELKNKETENTETPHKKTHFVVKPNKKTYEFNGKIYQTKTSMLRAKHNSEKYQFSLNRNSSEIASNQGKPDTKNLDAMLDKTKKTINELNNLSEQIIKEEARSTMIQTKLAKLR